LYLKNQKRGDLSRCIAVSTGGGGKKVLRSAGTRKGGRREKLGAVTGNLYQRSERGRGNQKSGQADLKKKTTERHDKESQRTSLKVGEGKGKKSSREGEKNEKGISLRKGAGGTRWGSL